MHKIEVNNLTCDYGKNRGVFDVSFTINQGEIFGFLGPNGAGKTTTIRHLMGFIKSKKGNCKIDGMDCWKQRDKIQRKLGYIPGEINFFDDMTGTSFLKFIQEYRGDRINRKEELLKRFDLNPNIKIRKMSKGMKQKLGIVVAFMHDPDILILDEPTSGLDPLMQNRFIELLEEEKQRGKTILLSSHMFEEVERTCHRIGMIRNGKIVEMGNVEDLRKQYVHPYTVTLETEELAQSFAKEFCGVCQGTKVTVTTKQTLEDIFLQYYGGKKDESSTV